jgi:two-component system, probable response regulator PhcQ
MNDIQAATILYVDDETTALKYFQRAIGALAPVLTAASVEEGKRVLDAHCDTIAVLVSDQRMPGGHGNELLAYARVRHPHIVRILTTAYSELDQTVEAVNQGQIHRYIQKPWEIAALRMELKQALDLARLRHDHDQLLREKLLIRQKQLVATRIGVVCSICAAIGGAAPAPLTAYLGAALGAGLCSPEPDWLLMDYSDLISAEAFRSAAFAAAVRDQYAALERRYPGSESGQAIAMLAEEFGQGVRTQGETGAVFLDGRVLAEFLEMPSEVLVSARHALWLASLLWLAKRDSAFEVARAHDGIGCQLAPAGAPLSRLQLANWIEQF